MRTSIPSLTDESPETFAVTEESDDDARWKSRLAERVHICVVYFRGWSGGSNTHDPRTSETCLRNRNDSQPLLELVKIDVQTFGDDRRRVGPTYCDDPIPHSLGNAVSVLLRFSPSGNLDSEFLERLIPHKQSST
jgi:hypothetical protein